MTSLNIFTKCPYTGNPKTRMQSFLTDKERTFISKYMLLNILQEVTKLNDILINLWVYPKYKHPFFQKIQSKYKINLVEQIGDSLNHRMQNCIALQSKKFKKIILIGSDIPSLTYDIIELTINFLDKNDYVIGPSKDGGFYLLAKNNFNNKSTDMLQDIGGNFSSIKKTLDEKQINYKILPKLKDIDTKEDLLFI